MIIEGIKMEDAKNLLKKITVENVITQIADGWESSRVIAKYIVGENVWESLPEDDRKILTARVHSVIRENKLLYLDEFMTKFLKK